MSSESVLRTITLNVRSLRTEEGRQELVNFLGEMEVDVAVLQETWLEGASVMEMGVRWSSL